MTLRRPEADQVALTWPGKRAVQGAHAVVVCDGSAVPIVESAEAELNAALAHISLLRDLAEVVDARAPGAPVRRVAL